MNIEQQKALEVSKQLKLIANPHRLLVLCSLVKQPYNVTTLASIVGISQTAMSNHLARLREANVIDYKREHRELIYYIADQRMVALINSICHLYDRKDNLSL